MFARVRTWYTGSNWSFSQDIPWWRRETSLWARSTTHSPISIGTVRPPPFRALAKEDGQAPNFEWSYSFGSGIQATDLLANNLYVTAYFVDRPSLIGAGGIVNNASYASSGVVPGEIVAIFGTNLTDGASCPPPSRNPTFRSNGKLNTTMAALKSPSTRHRCPSSTRRPDSLASRFLSS